MNDAGSDPKGPSPQPERPAVDGLDWKEGAQWALLLTRWIAAQVAVKRLEALRVVPVVAIGLGVLAFIGSFLLEPDWPWLIAGGLLLLFGGVVLLVVTVLIAVVRRLALARKARPLASALTAAKDDVIAEVAAAGVPVSLWTLVRFVLDAARGRAPHRGVVDRLGGVAQRLDQLVDTRALRATLGPGPGAAPSDAPPGHK